MFSDRIPDDRITASSWLSAKHLPRYGRLDRNMGHGAWCSARNDAQPYLEIDVEIEHMITGIIIQGKHRLSSDKLGFAWVTEFFLSFTANRKNWTFVTDVKSSQPIVSKISRTEMSYFVCFSLITEKICRNQLIVSEQALIINPARHAFLLPREDLSRISECFDGGLALISVLDFKTSYFPRPRKRWCRMRNKRGLFICL